MIYDRVEEFKKWSNFGLGCCYLRKLFFSLSFKKVYIHFRVGDVQGWIFRFESNRRELSRSFTLQIYRDKVE